MQITTFVHSLNLSIYLEKKTFADTFITKDLIMVSKCAHST